MRSIFFFIFIFFLFSFFIFFSFLFFSFILFYFILFYFILFYFILFYFILFYFILYYYFLYFLFIIITIIIIIIIIIIICILKYSIQHVKMGLIFDCTHVFIGTKYANARVKGNLEPTHLKSSPLFTFSTKSLGQDSPSVLLFYITIGSRFTTAKINLGENSPSYFF